MARPKKAIKRREKLTLYDTKAESLFIEKMAESHGMSRAEFARKKSLNHRLKARMTDEEALIYRDLIGMANNLNQLAHRVNAGEVLISEIKETLEAINFSIDRLR